MTYFPCIIFVAIFSCAFDFYSYTFAQVSNRLHTVPRKGKAMHSHIDNVLQFKIKRDRRLFNPKKKNYRGLNSQYTKFAQRNYKLHITKLCS